MSENNHKVGQATASETIKSRWYKEGKKLSLKAFARKLLSEGDQIAKDWFDCKKGALNSEQSDKTRARIDMEKSATKLSRRSTKTKKPSAGLL